MWSLWFSVCCLNVLWWHCPMCVCVIAWPCRTCGILSRRRPTEASFKKGGSTPRTPSCAPTNWSQSSLKSGACKHAWSSLYTRSGHKSCKCPFLAQPNVHMDWCCCPRRFISCSENMKYCCPWAKSAFYNIYRLPCSYSFYLGCLHFISTIFPKSILPSPLQSVSLGWAVPALSLPKAHSTQARPLLTM